MHWLKMVYSLRAAHMLRTKGIVRVSGSDAPLIVQAVGPVMSPPATLDAWPGGAPKTQLVFILRDLSADLLKASFERHVLST